MPIQVYKHSLSFVFTAHNESLGETHTEWRSQTEQWGLERIPYSAMGWQLSAWVSWLPRLEASHMICFSHQRERDCPRPLICLSHDLDLWVLLSVFSHGHKEILHCCLPQMASCYLKGNRKYQTFASSFGYPPATGNDPSTCVEDNESSCALGLLR